MASVGGVPAANGTDQKVALTIGNFDGCHAGHASLVARARELAGPGGRVEAMCFYPHPRTVLEPRPQSDAKPVLMTYERREAVLRGMGADEVIRLEPTRELLAMTPDRFVSGVLLPRRPSWIVEGEDFRFGKARAGDVRTLAALGAHLGFGVEVAGTVEVAMSDQRVAPASSSLARWLVGEGRVEDAAAVLGRAHTIDGVVERGDRRGREIGFPTANVRTACLPPREGIYAGVAHLADGRSFTAAIHVGRRPTFDDPRPTIEAFVLGWAGPVAEGREEYGWTIALEFRRWVRDQLRFPGVGPLVEQMNRDVALVRAMSAGWERAGCGVPA